MRDLLLVGRGGINMLRAATYVRVAGSRRALSSVAPNEVQPRSKKDACFVTLLGLGALTALWLGSVACAQKSEPLEGGGGPSSAEPLGEPVAPRSLKEY
jgi:hypothetical protein